MREIDETALIAANDERLFEKFIKNQKPFIINCIARVSHKYVTVSDDEWSIALMAFSDAVKTYKPGDAGFLYYAEMIIRRRLIDYHRVEIKYNAERSVDPAFFETEPDDDDEAVYAAMKLAITEKVIETTDYSLKYEIEAISNELQKYGFAFHHLVNCSPHSKKTREACKKVVLFILGDDSLMNLIKMTKRLPIKIIQDNTKIPRKLLEFYRRYLIAAVEILSGEYLYLSEYVSYIRKDGF
ncbi:MAG: hypothetical protein ACYCWE_11115 [Eubacteriales bacterium]